MKTIYTLTVGALALICVTASAQPRYSVRIIDSILPLNSGTLNLLGGSVSPDNDSNFAAIWDNGIVTNKFGYYDSQGALHTHGGFVNSLGDLVGAAEVVRLSYYHAALWTREGQFLDLGTLDNGRSSYAYDVSDDRWVVGYSSASGGIKPFVWHDGQMQDIGLLGFGRESTAYAINERHQVVGMEVAQEGDRRAWIWDQVFGLRWIMPRVDSAFDINDLGEVVGNTYIWKDGKMRIIGGDEAVAINNRSEVVGGRRTKDYPYYWEPTYWDPKGKMYDLNKLVLPGSGFVIHQAYDINDYGQIVALGIAENGDYRFLLLTPIRPQVVP